MTAVLTGGCLCGAVAYEVDDDFAYAAMCHCSQCRRATGSAFKPFGGIQRDRLRLLTGTPIRYGDSDDACDVLCGTCGSLLWSVVREGAWVHVAYGSLHDSPSRLPDRHIMVGSKSAWETIADGLPQHDTFG